MRIAVVAYQYPPTKGGLSGYSFDLVKYLKKRGHILTLFCNKDCDGDAPIFDNFLETKATKRNLWRILKWNIKHREKFQIVHATEIPAAYCGWLLAFLSGARLIISVHGNDFLQTRNGWVLKVLSNFVLKRAVIIANSSNTGKWLLDAGFKNHVINPGLDVDFMKSSYKKINKPNQPVVLFISKLRKYKGADLIIEAMKHLPQHLLIIAGDGTERQNLEKLAKNMKNIKFVGWVDPRPYYAIADILVVTSQTIPGVHVSNSFGKVYVEAACFGVPSIAFSIDGFCDAVYNGVSGFVLDQDVTPKDIANAILKLNKKNMSEDCKKWAENFYWDKQITKFEEVFNESLTNC